MFVSDDGASRMGMSWSTVWSISSPPKLKLKAMVPFSDEICVVGEICLSRQSLAFRDGKFSETEMPRP